MIRLYRKDSAGFQKVFTLITRNNLPLAESEHQILIELLGENGLYEISDTRTETPVGTRLIEIYPQSTYASPKSSKSLQIFENIDLPGILRCEESKIFFILEDLPLDDFLKTLPDFDPTNYSVRDGMEFTEDLYAKRTIAPHDSTVCLMSVTQETGIQALIRAGIAEADAPKWHRYFTEIEKRNPYELEIDLIVYGFTQHSKHPKTKSKFDFGGVLLPSVMDTVTRIWKEHPGNAISAFHDNSSSIAGSTVPLLISNSDGTFEYVPVRIDHLAKVETHNFPTAVSPYQGMATGVGGCTRDILMYGLGGQLYSAFDLIAVPGIKFRNGYRIPGTEFFDTPKGLADGLEILVQGTYGGCNYLNELGTPNTMGKMHSFSLELASREKFAYYKPNAAMGMLGISPRANAKKQTPRTGMLIIRIGGLGWPVGFGGGLGSSVTQGTFSIERDRSAVQRGDALIAIEVHKVINELITMSINGNPIIKSAHDQGAAGICNVTGEIVEDAGGWIDLHHVACGTEMSNREKFLAEFQESYVILIDPEDLDTVRNICGGKKVHMEVLGKITGDGRFKVIDAGNVLVDMQIGALENSIESIVVVDEQPRALTPIHISETLTFRDMVKYLLAQLAVGHKGWKIHKGDQTVGGRTVMHQYGGPIGLPVNDATCIKTSLDMHDTTGVLSALGHLPNALLVDPVAGAQHAVVHAFLNLIAGAPGDIRLEEINALVNEMWPCSLPGEDLRMHQAVTSATNIIEALLFRIIGGKDSVSFSTKVGDEIVKSLETLLVTLIVPVTDVSKCYTPYIKQPGKSHLGLIDLSGGNKGLSGSYFAQSLGQVGDRIARLDSDLILRGAQFVLHLKREGLILSCHDTMSDGVFVTIMEMALAGCAGVQCTNGSDSDAATSFANWFANFPGMLVEYMPDAFDTIMQIADTYDIPFTSIGFTRGGVKMEENVFTCSHVHVQQMFMMSELMQWFDTTSYRINTEQMNKELAYEAHQNMCTRTMRPYTVPFQVSVPVIFTPKRTPRVAILWEKGSNGISEMAAWVKAAGMEAVDVSMDSLERGDVSLRDMDALHAVGGFSFGDVFGSGVAWGSRIKHNPKLFGEFENFFSRKNTLGLGVCNGFQLFIILDRMFNFMMREIPLKCRPRLVPNKSGKFEAYEPRIIIPRHQKIWLAGMAGSEFSVPSAHGEGRLSFSLPAFATHVMQAHCPIFYADDNGEATMQYPFNPSGSYGGMAALQSGDHRFLGMMPHPERLLSMDNFSWKGGFASDVVTSPWIHLVENEARWLYDNMDI